MKLADIMNEWDKDSKIDEANLATESIGVPRLHSKYLRILTTEKVILNNLIIEKDSLSNTLMRYFLGEIDGKDINRPPFQLKLTKTNAEKALLGDQEYMAVIRKIRIQEEKLLFLKEVVDQINRRSFHIKNYIEYKKWLKGDG